jgi:monolysocardiolipin acyltransferase
VRHTKPRPLPVLFNIPAGMFQPGLAAAEARLAAGDWVHLFPEGTRSRDGRMGPVRKGVGRLVASCEVAPLIVPFVHSGMEEVMPRGRLVPRVGKEVRSVCVGGGGLFYCR